jgi:cell division protein FtsQ
VSAPARLRRATSRGFASGPLVVVLLFAAAVAGIAWVSMGIVASDRWPIRWLEINGEFQRVSAEQLRASLTPKIDSSFFTIDLRELDEAASRIPWVSAVRIQKKWPDTVSVAIAEYEPVAHWNRGWLISKSGEAFSVPEADSIQGLPWLQGPDGRLEAVLDAWAEFNDLLMPLGLEVRRVTLNTRGAWSMELDNGTLIHLGRESAIERLDRLLIGWESLISGRANPPQAIDLRYTNGFAVLWPGDLPDSSGAES